MYLSKLKIFGFKSFCDKLEVNLGQGVIAIVGPNGCGKSNIVDAIRWVFGEQKNSILRSDQMEDLIFSGTAKRQPLNMAEVSLVINNEDGMLPVEYPEVMITRRLYRSGESEYRLNKVPCRLKDINNLFFDTGMGANAYTTIEGKMIDKILSDKATERRLLFEEAAGISKYKRQRQESLRQLERTSSDLLRIHDKVEEVTRNVNILKRHVSKATRFKEYTTELKDLEVSYENHRYGEMRSKIDLIEKQLRDIERQKNDLVVRRDKECTGIEQKNLHLVQQEGSLQAAQEKVNSVSGQIVELEKNQSVTEEKIYHLQNTIQNLAKEIEFFSQRIVEAEQKHTDTEKTMLEQRTLLEEKEQESTKKSGELEAFLEQMQGARDESARANLSHIQILEQLAEKRNQSSEIKAEILHIKENVDNLKTERATLTKKLDEIEGEVRAARQKLESASQESSNLMDSREKLMQEIEDKENLYRAIVEEEKNLEAQMIATEEQLKFLESLNVTYEGYAAGTKAIIEAKDTLPGIKGILADKIKIKPQYIRAVESFLGNNAQTIIMENIKDSERALEFLEEGHLGRATLLALDRLAEKTFTELPAELLQETGVIARGADCVEIEPSLMPLVHHLLDYVLVVEDRATAERLAEKWASRRLWFVTLTGESHATSGFVTGGKTGKTEIGLISRKQTIEKLRSDCDTLKERFTRKRSEKERCVETRAEARTALVEADERLNRGRRVQHEQETHLKHLDQRIIRIHDRITEIDEEISGANTRIAEREKTEEGIHAEMEAMIADRGRIEQDIERIKQDLVEKDATRSGLQETVHLQELETTGLRNRIEQLTNDTARFSEEMSRSEEMKLEKQERMARSREELETIQQGLAGIKEKTGSIARERETLEAARDKEREQYTGMLNEIETMRKNEKAISGELEKLNDGFHNIEMGKVKYEGDMRSIRERIWEAYHVDLDSLPEEMPQVEWEADNVADRIDTLKERIRRVGQVNMAALDDYEEESKRLEELTVQRDDLTEAKESLEKAIKKLDRTARQQFLETFEKVQKNFKEVFVSLFGGGDAYVNLELDKDPLEANIEINARPTGKKMRGVGLLSGGERALTAIALLFSLYLTRPSPYCVMDEVDAPLDDANISRFANLLRNFSKKTQFVVITHNKVTMESSDILYGVTMQERGVSKLVSVRFDEAEAMAA